MIINHNIMALNAWRNLGQTNTAMSKSLEKLSSGLRINRAADDAAGLAISEKMRAQIRGLQQAVRNAQDGISLIQTAEGALNETHSILQRMRELAVQAANDTETDADRAQLEQELEALIAEIDRIANTTEFNTQALLNSSFNGKSIHIGANSGQALTISISNMGASALGVAAADITVSTQTGADAAIKAIDSAINLVSSERS
ncbi:MAG: flagellin, partial [Peptococcaceae bacterium]|nr:flagellin [Peptococcaceae bacterium]